MNVVRKMKGIKTDHLSNRDRVSIFSSIYKQGVWVHADSQRSVSGVGSDERVANRFKAQFEALLVNLDCGLLVDVGCGDWNWMKNVKLSGNYIGIDIVKEVIEANRRCYESDRVLFQILDAVTMPVPTCDVAFCREVLFHLSFKDAKSVLKNLVKRSKWILVTSDLDIWFNSDIQTGDFRSLNLLKHPFGLPHPHQMLNDDAISPGRRICLWRSSDIIRITEKW